MTTALCTGDCKLRRITRERWRELVYQDSRIAFHLVGVITARLLQDVKLLRVQPAASS